MHKRFIGIVACGVLFSFMAVESFAAIGLTTMFATNNSQSGNMFDLVTSSNALTVRGFDLNLGSGTWTIELYTKPGTYNGSQNSPGSWTLLDSQIIVSNGPNNPTPFDSIDFALAASTFTGIYLTGTIPDTGVFLYTNGTSVGTVAAADANLQILQGAGMSYPFAGVFEPRIWNGTVYYDVATPGAVPEFSSIIVWSVLVSIGLISRRRNRPGA